MRKKKSEKKKNSSSSRPKGFPTGGESHDASFFLLKRGNVGLTRLLIAVSNSGPNGISTYKLLYELGSTNHGKSFLKRAEKEGLIERVKGESPRGQFAPIFNIITPKGRELLQRSLSV